MDTYLVVQDDTGANVLDSVGNVVQSDDISDVPLDQCSSLTVTIPPSTTYFAVVGECGENDVISEYVLEVTFQ